MLAYRPSSSHIVLLFYARRYMYVHSETAADTSTHNYCTHTLTRSGALAACARALRASVQSITGTRKIRSMWEIALRRARRTRTPFNAHAHDGSRLGPANAAAMHSVAHTSQAKSECMFACERAQHAHLYLLLYFCAQQYGECVRGHKTAADRHCARNRITCARVTERVLLLAQH